MDMEELHLEILTIFNEDREITDSVASELIQRALSIQNQTKALQYFCSLVLYHNKIHLLHLNSIFPKYTKVIKRLQSTLKVIDNDDYIRALITQEQAPQYPSIYLFAISYLVMDRKVLTKRPYHQELGRSWINYFKNPYKIESPSYSTMALHPDDDVEEDSILKLRKNLDLFIFRLKSAEEFVSSYLSGGQGPYPVADDIQKLALLEEINHIRTIPIQIREKNPLKVLERRNTLLELARNTNCSDIFNEIYDSCKNYGMGNN